MDVVEGLAVLVELGLAADDALLVALATQKGRAL